MKDGEQVYYGGVKGLMDVVDYHLVKLPASVILERARRDAPPVFAPALPPHSSQPLITFKDVHFRYKQDLPEVLQGITFEVHPGDVIGILGHNGAGKTTMVKHALGLLKPTQGRVLLEGRDTRQTTVAQSAHTIGYVFQSPTQMLFAPTVAEELAFGPRT